MPGSHRGELGRGRGAARAASPGRCERWASARQPFRAGAPGWRGRVSCAARARAAGKSPAASAVAARWAAAASLARLGWWPRRARPGRLLGSHLAALRPRVGAAVAGCGVAAGLARCLVTAG